MMNTSGDQVAYAEVNNPAWNKSRGRVHDWRNHIGERTKAIWEALPIDIRQALAEDAQEMADLEDWP
ncbi:MAG TPA: hypothetical protein VL418_00605 [Devosiaceae bacterium]|nr:hypothetical protein [Devosiaceae bacterium]